MGVAPSNAGSRAASFARPPGSAQKRSVLAAQALAGPLFALLAEPGSHERLREVGASMGEGPAAAPPAGLVVDANAPALAPLVRAACQADPTLADTASRLVGTKFADSSSFWTTYFSRVLEAQATSASSGLPAAGPMLDSVGDARAVREKDFVTSVSEKPSHPEATVEDVSIDSTAATLSPAVAAPAAIPTLSADGTPAGVPSADVLSANIGSTVVDDDEEILLLVLPEVFVYKLDARHARASGYTALSWGLDKPLLTGYLRAVAHGESEVSLAVWQRPDQLSAADSAAAATSAAGAAATSSAASRLSTAPGAAGHKLVAVCRIILRPRAEAVAAAATAAAAASGDAALQRLLLPQPLAYYLEPTLDSSRYFAMRISGADGRSSVIGIGFRDRQASFDLRSMLDDALQRVARSWELASSSSGGIGSARSDSAAADSDTSSSSLAAALSTTSVAIGPLAPGAIVFAGGRGSVAASSSPEPQPHAVAPQRKLRAPRSYAATGGAEKNLPSSSTAAAGVDDTSAWGEFEEAR